MTLVQRQQTFGMWLRVLSSPKRSVGDQVCTLVKRLPPATSREQATDRKRQPRSDTSHVNPDGDEQLAAVEVAATLD